MVSNFVESLIHLIGLGVISTIFILMLTNKNKNTKFTKK